MFEPMRPAFCPNKIANPFLGLALTTKNLESLLQVGNIARQLLAAVLAKHVFTCDGLKLPRRHLESDLFRKNSKWTVRGMKEEMVDNLLAHNVDKTTSSILIEGVKNIVYVSTSGIEGVIPSELSFNKLTCR